MAIRKVVPPARGFDRRGNGRAGQSGHLRGPPGASEAITVNLLRCAPPGAVALEQNCSDPRRAKAVPSAGPTSWRDFSWHVVQNRGCVKVEAGMHRSEVRKSTRGRDGDEGEFPGFSSPGRDYHRGHDSIHNAFILPPRVGFLPFVHSNHGSGSTRSSGSTTSRCGPIFRPALTRSPRRVCRPRAVSHGRD